MATTPSTGPSLTQVTYFGRQGVKVALIFIVTLMVGRFFFDAFLNFWKATHPPAPPPPTMGFGALPPIVFPEESETSKPTSYQLETATGKLPAFEDRAKVFLMPKQSASLLDDEAAKKIAADLGFVFKPEEIDSQTYRWSKAEPLQSVLEMDLPSKNFILTTDYLSRPDLLLNVRVPQDTSAVSTVKSFIQKGELLGKDVATVSGEVTYMKTAGTDLQPAVSYSDADYVQVDIHRSPIDQLYPMVTPEGKKGIIHGIVAGNNRGSGQIVKLEYHYHPVDYSQVETYPLRSVQNAWKIVQGGEAYIAQSKVQGEALIRDVYLAYFDSYDPQEYLQPVYVFVGDDEFMAFVSALDPEVIRTSASQN